MLMWDCSAVLELYSSRQSSPAVVVCSGSIDPLVLPHSCHPPPDHQPLLHTLHITSPFLRPTTNKIQGKAGEKLSSHRPSSFSHWLQKRSNPGTNNTTQSMYEYANESYNSFPSHLKLISSKQTPRSYLLFC